MPEVYPDSIKLEMQFAGTACAWTDVTEDLIRSTPITCTYGIQDSSPLARVASTGTFNFNLDNSELNSAGLVGYYSPGHANCRSGFEAGITVRFSVIYGGITYPKFYGRIPATGIQIVPGSNKERQTMVEVRDFMEQCAIHEIDSPAFVQNKTAAEVIQLILAEQSIQPLATEYNTCEDTFFSAFENQNEKINCLVEISKACLSEFGYAYVRHDTSNYEKFVVEGRKTRTGITSATTISVSTPIELCGYLQKEDSGKFQLEDGSGYIKLDEASVFNASFDNEQYDAVIQNGNDLYNSIEVNSINKTIGTVTPVKVWTQDYGTYATDQIFIKLDWRLDGTDNVYVGSIILQGDYSIPSHSKFTCIGLINPVGTTDYRFDTSVITASSTMTISNLYNSCVGTVDIYRNVGTNYYGTVSSTYETIQLQVRGTPLFQENVSQQFNGTASINDFGKSTLTIDMPYQAGTGIPGTIANALLTQYQDPVTRTENCMFFANKDMEKMYSFLILDIGDRFTYQETVSGINEDYFINGVNFEVHANNVIKFGYKTKAAELEVF
jgi:hypothetical protein